MKGNAEPHSSESYITFYTFGQEEMAFNCQENWSLSTSVYD